MAAQAHNGSDPYRAWLNVKQVERPLTAYQLLGLEALEDDVETIRAADGLQRVAIQTHRDEAPPDGERRSPSRRRAQPTEKYEITCDQCGARAEVPFKPAEGRDVFCQSCYRARKPPPTT